MAARYTDGMHEKPGDKAKDGPFVVCIVLALAWIILALKWIDDRLSPTYPFGSASATELAICAAVLLAYSVWFGRKLLK